MENKERTQKLNEMLQDVISKIQDDDFDNEDKAFFVEIGTKILARIADLNKAL